MSLSLESIERIKNKSLQYQARLVVSHINRALSRTAHLAVPLNLEVLNYENEDEPSILIKLLTSSDAMFFCLFEDDRESVFNIGYDIDFDQNPGYIVGTPVGELQSYHVIDFIKSDKSDRV